MKLVLVLWIAACVAAARVLATTVVAMLQVCPLCQKQFARSSIGSWFQGSEPDRDFGGSMQAASARVIMCPHCLFSAIPSEFRFTDATESNAVAKALADLRQRIRPLPEALRARALQNGDDYGVELLQYRVAQVCDAARQPDAARTAALYHSAYLWLKYGDDAAVVAEERQQAIRAFEAAAQPVKGRPPSDPYWTYLAGEVRRCAGDTNGALAWLEEAVRLAGAPGKEFALGSLGRWANEQADKARHGDTNDSHPTRIHGPEWDEQRRALQRRLPEMVVALNSGQPPREWLLEGQSRLNTVWVVSDLAEEGNQDAVEFLFGWLARLENTDLPSRDYQVRRSVGILARHSQAISEKAVAGAKFRVQPLGEAARYAVRGGPLPGSLTRALAFQGPISIAAQAGVSAAAVRRDKSAKPFLLARMKQGEDYHLANLVKEYFSVAGVFVDIPALERFAEKFGKKASEDQHDPTGFTRRDIEDAVRLIRMREILGD